MKLAKVPADLPDREGYLTACQRAAEEEFTCPLERACRLPPFSDEQDRHLFNKMQTAGGTQKAELRRLIIESSLGLVLGLARWPDPPRRGIKAQQRSLKSKFELGKAGLASAVDAYRPSQKEPFREFALAFIRRSMKPLF